jgi:hypothetical protein
MMMPAKHFSQTPPDKANELFNELLANSNNSVDTRERLFSTLKEELELLANLQEQHLFPILRAHGMEDLLQHASKDNDETSTILAKLEGMPKDSNEFLGKVEELRTVFQQHIRNDKKELLPAVLKVLSNEETEAVAEKVANDVAGFEEAKRVDTKPASQQSEKIRQAAPTVTEIVRTGTERAQVVARGMQDISHECLRLSQERLQTNLDGISKLIQCRSVQELAATQASLARLNIEQTLYNTLRIVELAVQFTGNVVPRPTEQMDRTPQHSRDFA